MKFVKFVKQNASNENLDVEMSDWAIFKVNYIFDNNFQLVVFFLLFLHLINKLNCDHPIVWTSNPSYYNFIAMLNVQHEIELTTIASTFTFYTGDVQIRGRNH